MTGSDSGIGHVTAIKSARAGEDVAITYFEDCEGADRTLREVEATGRKGFVTQL